MQNQSEKYLAHKNILGYLVYIWVWVKSSLYFIIVLFVKKKIQCMGSFFILYLLKW